MSRTRSTTKVDLQDKNKRRILLLFFYQSGKEEKNVLMMFSENIAKLPLANAFPFDADKLAVMPGPEADYFFVLKDIRSADGKHFPLDIFMEKFPIFHCPSFKKRMEDFAPIMESRLERFFKTKKSKYIFFDGEEQVLLRSGLSRGYLQCVVDIYAKQGSHYRQLRCAELDWLPYQKIREAANKMGIVHIMRLDTYVMMSTRLRKFSNLASRRFAGSRSNWKSEWAEAADKAGLVAGILNAYPEFNVKTKKEFTKAYRKLAQKLHPDISTDPRAVEIFARMSTAADELKASSWFRRLKEG